jgi:pyridoxine 4-dehydrogenase
MSTVDQSGTFTMGGRTVKRLGYGAMQLAGSGVFGPPKDRDAALAVLREAVGSGVNHIDTSDFYGPHVTNRLIREALRHQNRRPPRRRRIMDPGGLARRTYTGGA